jgi:ABC-type transport system involved in multi-copper enzyme maturation permease subunit
MIPGPVFNFELLTTARRGRFYAVRGAYAFVLLMIFWIIHLDWATERGGTLTVKQVGAFALVCFGGVSLGQMLLVLTLTPALVAGVIADEKQRKTLHYLLASRLSGPEIVIGKLPARMLHVGVLLAVSVPVLSMLVLLGGIDPVVILLACGAAASSAWFLAALSIWVSTIARRVREALFVAYGLEFLWLFFPFIFRQSPSVGWPLADSILNEAIDWLAASSPAELVRELISMLQSGSTTFLASIIVMIEIELAAGFLLAALAAWQLRPVFRAQEGAGERRRGLREFLSGPRTMRVWRRPKLVDRPMLWKELFTSRARGLTRLVAVLLSLVVGVSLIYWTIWFGAMAFLEMRDNGYAPSQTVWFAQVERARFFWFIRFVVPLLYVAGILSVAGAAAASITSEHEDDTWTSLTATDLTPREIVLAKLLGALWRLRGIAVVIFLLTSVGCLVGSVHPLSLPILALALLIYGWFAAALGIWISLQLRSTWRAQFLTIAGLVLLNLTGQAVLSNVQRWAPLVWPGFTPYEISKTLLPLNFQQEWAASRGPVYLSSWSVDNSIPWLILLGVLSLAIYLVGALTLTVFSLTRFEAVAGRARVSQVGNQTAPLPSLASN